MASTNGLSLRGPITMRASDDCKGIDSSLGGGSISTNPPGIPPELFRRVAVVPQIRIASYGRRQLARSRLDHSQARRSSIGDRKFMAVWIGNPGMALSHADILAHGSRRSTGRSRMK